MRNIIKPLLVIACASFLQVGHAALPPVGPNGQPVSSLSDMLQTVMPTIVNVSAQGEIAAQTNPLAESGDSSANKPPHKFESLGSGVILDAGNGYVITNAHVLRGAKTVTVTLGDGRVFKAKPIGMDVPSDVAVIQIKADKLTAATFGDSDKLKVGDFVAAIGNPFGLSQTVTSGIVSALERSGLGIEGYENFIQTDASINPGNSGGALVNMQGQVIGINTAIVSPAGGNIGIGFAIPIDMARTVANQLIKYGTVARGMVGVLVQDLTPDLATAFNLPGQSGALISLVSPNTPAAAAGIKSGDIITDVDGEKITNAEEVRNNIGLLRVGSTVSITYLRNGKSDKVSLVTADPEKYLELNQVTNPFLFGVTLRDFDEQTSLQGHVKGVQVVGISQNSMAWHGGLRLGDIIVSANLKSVNTLGDLQTLASQSKTQLLLDVISSQNGGEFIVIKQLQGD